MSVPISQISGILNTQYSKPPQFNGGSDPFHVFEQRINPLTARPLIDYPHKKKHVSTIQNISAAIAGVLTANFMQGTSLKAVQEGLTKRLFTLKDTMPVDKAKTLAESMVKKYGLNKPALNFSYDIYKVIPNLPFQELSDKQQLHKILRAACVSGKDSLSGKNMLYAFAPAEKASYILHELGHASHYKNKLIRNFMLAGKTVVPRVFGIALILGMVHNTSQDTGQRKGINKVTGFIHDNIGKLAFLSMTPVLADELMASTKAISHAAKSKLLTPTELKAFKGRLGLAFSTYLLATVGLIIASKTGIYLKDKLTEHFASRNALKEGVSK
jgi:hypothetical protein